MTERLIQTDEENQTILRIIERLMNENPEKDSPGGMLLRSLTNEVIIYEKKYDIK